MRQWVICKWCKAAGKKPKDCEVPVEQWQGHVYNFHQERIEETALMAIDTAEEQVAYVYEHHPEARQSNGRLMLLALKGYRPAEVRSWENGDASIIVSSYMAFGDLLKHCGSLARLGRAIRRAKATGEELPRGYSHLFKVKVRDAVKLVLDKNPAAFYNEGVLCEEVLRYFPIEGVSCVYDRAMKTVSIQAPTEILENVLARLETIMRRSREIRNGDGNQYDPSHVKQEREIAFAFSTSYWKTRNGNPAKRD